MVIKPCLLQNIQETKENNAEHFVVPTLAAGQGSPDLYTQKIKTNLSSCSSCPPSSSCSSWSCLWAVGTLRSEVCRSAGSVRTGRLEGETERGLTQGGLSCLPLFGLEVGVAAFYRWHFCYCSFPPSGVHWLGEERGLQRA